MENKAIHYDGSIQMNDETHTNPAAITNEPFEMTDVLFAYCRLPIAYCSPSSPAPNLVACFPGSIGSFRSSAHTLVKHAP